MTRNIATYIVTFVLMFAFAVDVNAANSSRNRSNKGNETPPPQVYTERAKKLLDSLAADNVFDRESPFTESQKEELNSILKSEDSFYYDQPRALEIKNEVIKVSLRDRKIIHIKLGHTYNASIVFTDALGNPWTTSMLTDMSNSDVVSVKSSAPHILTARPLKRSGQTNLPIKLAGEQYPLMLMFDVNDKEAYFNADIRVDGMGDHKLSQQALSMAQYQKGQTVTPKLGAEPAKEMMLQFLTPEGYSRRQLVDEYGNDVDVRDFMAWTYKDRLYIITPHNHYTPEPLDVSSASDGRHRLFEFSNTSVALMRKNSKVLMIHIK